MTCWHDDVVRRAHPGATNDEPNDGSSELCSSHSTTTATAVGSRQLGSEQVLR
ncbi:MAG: hypothetical protein ABIT38_13765 [Gemmatimonadaceae bacterium]